MPVRLNGSTSGYTELSAPAVAGSNTLTLPTGNGSNGQFLQGNGSGTLSWSGSLTLGTAQNSTSGTAIDFTGIPSWVKRITVMFSGVSTSGTSNPLIQAGTSTGFTTTGYTAGSVENVTKATYTTGFGIVSGASANALYGHILITNISGNSWTATHTLVLVQAGVYYTVIGSGVVSLSAALDRIRITTVGGTDTFDAGSINILYEG